MVRWSIPAKNDLKQIFEYISKDSKQYAQKVTNDIIEKFDLLNDFPQLGRVVPEIEDQEVRELLIHSFRLIYRISLKNIEILALVHERRYFTTERFTS